MSRKTYKQAKEAEGNLHVGLYNIGFRFFYTRTAWRSEQHMLSFMRSGVHADAMKRSGSLARSLISMHYEAKRVPSWREVITMLKKEKAH